jgi:hypothetical protein
MLVCQRVSPRSQGTGHFLQGSSGTFECRNDLLILGAKPWWESGEAVDRPWNDGSQVGSGDFTFRFFLHRINMCIYIYNYIHIYIHICSVYMSIMNNLVLKTAWGLTEPLLWTVDGIHRPLVGEWNSRWFQAGKAQFGFPPNRNAPTNQMLVNQYFQLISMYYIYTYIYIYIDIQEMD